MHHLQQPISNSKFFPASCSIQHFYFNTIFPFQTSPLQAQVFSRILISLTYHSICMNFLTLTNPMPRCRVKTGEYKWKWNIEHHKRKIKEYRQSSLPILRFTVLWIFPNHGTPIYLLKQHWFHPTAGNCPLSPEPAFNNYVFIKMNFLSGEKWLKNSEFSMISHLHQCCDRGKDLLS